ncbi:MAG: DUF2959 domain-containing protein [Anaerohalosphaeraceae bacterium]|nr:DUF2959 domain-containing protein [Anaerohalosphaeraceae bacterium]
MRNFTFGSLFVLIFLSAGCQSVYYKTMEGFGKHKRDLLVDRVKDSRDAQEETKAQFASALEQFTTILNYDGGELQEKYNLLNDEFKKSQSKASTVRKRIKDVEQVSQDLFKEWEKELDQYTNNKLRASSKSKLDQTRSKYGRLITAMKKAETKIAPVLNAFRDQVLYLKHNLNAQAISSLQSELSTVESDIASLIDEMEVSIAQANEFIESMTE